MKTIKKIKESSKAVAGTALLVGATLAGGAAMVSAQSGSSGSGSMTLGDYPAPFINDEGQITSTIVMGEDAKATDVVAASNIAGQLGNDAFATKSVSAGSDSGSWSATNGQTLDTKNDNVYFGEQISTVRSILTQEHLDVLKTHEVLKGDAKQDVEQYLYVGGQSVGYGNPSDQDQNPFLYVNAPSGSNVDTNSAGNYLYKLQANFEDGIQFNDPQNSDNNFRNEDVYGQEMTLFGKTFTVADSSFQQGEQQLVLYGSSKEISVNSGESKTVTINGNEHTIKVVGVTGSNTAAIEIDGNLDQYSENEEEELSGQEVRVDNIIQTNADNSQGVVQLAIGSQKITLENGQPIMTGGDEKEIKGTHVTWSGTSDDYDVSDGNGEESISSIEIAFGAKNSDSNYVKAGEMMSNEVFKDVKFHFGGLNPDSRESGNSISVEGNGDDNAQVSFMSSSGDSASVNFAHYETQSSGTDGDATGIALEDDNNNDINVVEGATTAEDEYTVVESGEFSQMLQVTDVSKDEGSTSGFGDNEEETVTITLENPITGATHEVDFDENTEDGDATDGLGEGDTEQEIIDGQTYDVSVVDTGSVDSDLNDGSIAVTVEDTESDGIDVFAGLETKNEATVHLTAPVGSQTITNGNSRTWNLPSGMLKAKAVDDSNANSDSDLKLYVNGEGSPSLTLDGSATASGTATINVGGVTYALSYSSTNSDVTVSSFGVETDQTSSDSATGGNLVDSPGVMVQEEEGDDNTHDEYFVSAQHDGSNNDDRVELGDTADGNNAEAVYFSNTMATSSALVQHDSDDDVSSYFSKYGTYVKEDASNQGSYDFMYPAAQSAAGAAFTGMDGALEAGGGSGSVQTKSPTGWPSDAVALDSDDNIGQMKTNNNLILVGGPAANSLVSELAEANKTASVSEYTKGQGMLQLVEDAFNKGHDALVVAGYSGEDTRRAGQYLVNYEQHSDMLSGKDKVSINTAQGSVVQ